MQLNYKTLIKKILGRKLLRLVRPIYHGSKALGASWYYNRPSRKMILVGVNGTKGKTSTTIYAGRLANLIGIKTGYITTAAINVTGMPEDEKNNPYKMTTIDGVHLQKYLKKMHQNGCKACIIELSSQGLEQNRHIGLKHIDIGVFLNMYPEHIEAHGSIHNYRRAKSKLFRHIAEHGVFIGNGADVESEYMYNQIPKTRRASVHKLLISKNKDYSIKDSKKTIEKDLIINKKRYNTPFNADFEIDNAVFAIKIVQNIQDKLRADISPVSKFQEYFNNLTTIPGRMEWAVRNGVIQDSHHKIKKLANISILVDYAHEPESMKQLLTALREWKSKKYLDYIVHVVSCDGAGRDDWKKPIMGSTSKNYADFSILTTDNYDASDDPKAIIGLLETNFPKNQKNKTYFTFIKRKDAFKKALKIAKSLPKNKKVVIVSTGVGSEYGLTQPRGVIKWNEKDVWQNLFTQK